MHYSHERETEREDGEAKNSVADKPNRTVTFVRGFTCGALLFSESFKDSRHKKDEEGYVEKQNPWFEWFPRRIRETRPKKSNAKY